MIVILLLLQKSRLPAETKVWEGVRLWGGWGVKGGSCGWGVKGGAGWVDDDGGDDRSCLYVSLFCLKGCCGCREQARRTNGCKL